MQMVCSQSFNKRTYRKHHSTEIAVLKVISGALLATDRGKVTLLCLLDLSAAFDTVDHDILIDRLQTAFGIHDTVLSWISSFLKDRTQLLSLDRGRTHLTSSVVCHRVAFMVRCYFFYTPLRLLPSPIDTVLMHTRMLTTHSFTSTEKPKNNRYHTW